MQKGQGFHYMLREILEEPVALRETLAAIGSSCRKIASELAGERIGLIYFSGDSGADWVATSAGSNYWEYITCSADGNAWLALDVGHGIVWRLQIPPNPQLAITPRSGSLALSWPLPSMNFVLQQCSDLITPDWFNATGTPVLNLTNLQNEIVLSPTNGTGFYRLAAP